MVFSRTVVTPEILLIEWQQNHRTHWLLESAKMNRPIVLHYFSSETVQIWLKRTRTIYISAKISIMSELNCK